MSAAILKLATDVLAHIGDAILHAPHTDPATKGAHHVRVLTAIRRDVQLIVNLAGEAAGIEHDHGPDFKALLYELLDAVQLQGGRQGLATADRAGLDSALAAIREMGPLLGKRPDDRADLLEAVRAQDPTCTLELYKGDLGAKVTETIEDYPVPRVPVHGDNIDLPDGRRLNVVTVRMVGRAAIVRARVWAALPKLEDF